MARPVLLVTGASKGIGAACARLFATEGWDVGLTYLTDPDGAEQVAEECRAAGAAAHAVRADAASRAETARAFDAISHALGPIRCIISNAGVIGGATRIAELSEDALTRTMKANIHGPIWCLQEAARRMQGTGGSVVIMGSVAAVTGSPGEYIHYAASKAAVETLAVGAGKELAADSIRVNAIRVGTTETTLHARSGNPDRPATIAAATPLGRIATPEDIAEAALWLASDRAGFVTGTVLTVAGGLVR